MISKILFIIFLVLSCFSFANAGSVTLGWDPYHDKAEGFKVYYSSKSPVEVTPENLVATVCGSGQTQVTIKYIPNDKKYFVITAFDGILESEKSNEVETIIRPDKVDNFYRIE